MDRCKKLYHQMSISKLDAMLITDRNNVYYFSGFSGSSGYLVITEKEKILVTDFRYIEQAHNQATDFVIKDIADFDLTEYFKEGMAVGFENTSISYDKYNQFALKIKNLVPISTMLTDIRSVKDEYEISCIQSAADIADKAFEYIVSNMQEGMTEREVAIELEMFMRRNGADGLSFDTIVAAGARGSLPHAEPGENKLCCGDLVVLDYGCMVGGYCSDMTRTVAVGDISDRQLDVYNAVKRIQSSCLDMVKPGEKCSDIHEYSYNELNALYPGCYGHGLGHGVGLEIHELPNLNLKSHKLLVPGNVVTVEPGVYISGFCGVRIEDLVLVTEDGHRIMSKSTKELVKI